MKRGSSRCALLTALVAVAFLCSGCALTNRLFRDTAAEERAAALLQQQLSVMRFADEYAARVDDQITAFQQANNDPAERFASQTWLVTQATAVFTIAAGPSPQLNAIDMLIFASLSRMVVEDRWAGELYGKRVESLLATHRTLEERIWNSAAAQLSEEQIDELRSSIEDWHREHPLDRVVPFIHLDDLALATRRRARTASGTGSIFSFLGIDPLSNLDPAVREIAQTRQLAERAVYYGQRAPKLVSMEMRRLAFGLAITPESVELLQSVERLGVAAQATGELAANLPGLVAQERAAAIEQVVGLMDEREGRLRDLTVELQSALETGGNTSDSVRETILALQTLMTRFERRDAPPGTAARPFDVTEYTEALRQMSATAQQLQVLLRQADDKAPALGQLSDRATQHATSLVDHLFWRLVQLIVVLVGAVVLGSIAYRRFTRAGAPR
jgi:Tfp pilus assembly protein PilE